MTDPVIFISGPSSSPLQEMNAFNKLHGLPPQLPLPTSGSKVAHRGTVMFLRTRFDFIEEVAQRAGTGTFELLAVSSSPMFFCCCVRAVNLHVVPGRRR